VSRALIAASALLLAACSTLPPPPAPDSNAEAVSGRLAMQVAAHEGAAARQFSAAFDLHGNSRQGQLQLNTPLGTAMAQARWSPQEVTLVTRDGTRRFANLDALSTEALGESVPLAALFDWLHGRPWPEQPSRAMADGSFEQLGWAVTPDGPPPHPHAIHARRSAAPTVTLRALLDE
jgi:outer membrane lipoprotein LolB